MSTLRASQHRFKILNSRSHSPAPACSFEGNPASVVAFTKVETPIPARNPQIRAFVVANVERIVTQP